MDRNAGNDNWRFIAVTYDSTAAKEHVKLYIGTTAADVRLHKAVSYDRGPVGKGTGVLTVGHFHPAMRSNHSDRMFRGLDRRGAALRQLTRRNRRVVSRPDSNHLSIDESVVDNLPSQADRLADSTGRAGSDDGLTCVKANRRLVSKGGVE